MVAPSSDLGSLRERLCPEWPLQFIMFLGLANVSITIVENQDGTTRLHDSPAKTDVLAATVNAAVEYLLAR